MKASSLFYRIAGVLLLLFAAGHTLGFRQSDPTWGIDTLLGSMQSVHLTCRLSAGHIGISLSDSRSACFIYSRRCWRGNRWSGREFGGHGRHRVGFRSLLCRHHGCELALPLYPPCRFFNRDYRVFDRGGMAVSEAGCVGQRQSRLTRENRPFDGRRPCAVRSFE